MSEALWDRVRASLERLAARARPQTGASAERLAARAALLRGQPGPAAPAGPAVAVLAFRQGGARYGVPVEQVLEVQALDYFSPVPRAPAFLPGVIHWRGSILALIDLPALFGVAGSGLSDVHACVVVEAAGRRVAVAALEIEDLISVPLGELRPVPEGGGVPREWAAGVYGEDRLVLRMDAVLQDGRLTGWRPGA